MSMVPGTQPALLGDTQILYEATGPYAAADTSGTLLRWLSGIGSMLQTLDDLVRDSPSGPGWSLIMDLSRCRSEYLPWLAQFVGVRVDTSATAAAQRAQITDEPATKRGTVPALLAAASPYLMAGTIPHLHERDTDAYHATMVVFTNQLQGGPWDDLAANFVSWDAVASAFATWNAIGPASGPDLARAIDAAKPAGLVLSLTISDSGSWDDLAANFVSWDAVASAFATWNTVAAYLPPLS